MSKDDIPDDATGDALRRMRDDGANLSKPHDIDFHLAVPDESAAEYVLNAARELGYAASASKDEEGPNWTCCCTKSMVPEHAAISKIETRLNSIANKVGGWSDGWGAFAVP